MRLLFLTPNSVIPAQAGTQGGAGSDPTESRAEAWVPAFAGMTD